MLIFLRMKCRPDARYSNKSSFCGVEHGLGDPLTYGHAISAANGVVLVASLYDLGDNGATSTISSRRLPPRISHGPTNANVGDRLRSDLFGIGWCAPVGPALVATEHLIELG
jgi:hypothetical protein